MQLLLERGDNMWRKNVLNTMTSLNYKKIRNSIMAGAVMFAVIGGASDGSANYYKEQQKAQVLAAKSNVVRQEALAKNVNLLSDAQIKAKVANAINADENAIRFKELYLKNYAGQKRVKYRDNYALGFYPVYKVEAVYNGMEYEFTFDAVTGEVLKSDVDTEDND